MTLRAWESLSDVTCCKSLVVVYNGICILQAGFADVSCSNGGEPVVVDTEKLMKGSLYGSILKSGSRGILLLFYFTFLSLNGDLKEHMFSFVFSESYLANLSLYPGKSELPFLPSNTQVYISVTFFK